jgi:hypothetical protein
MAHSVLARAGSMELKGGGCLAAPPFLLWNQWHREAFA